jgi:hypothetical protein
MSENTLNSDIEKNVVMVTLNTGIIFFYSRACTFECGTFYEGGPRVRRPPMKWSTIVESLRNTALGHTQAFVNTELHVSIVNGHDQVHLHCN